MKTALHTIPLLSFLLITGCASRSELNRSSFKPGGVSPEAHEFSGLFRNAPSNWTNAPAGFHLWERLNRSITNSSQPNDTVLLVVRGRDTLHASLVRNGDQMASQNIRFLKRSDRLELNAVRGAHYRFPFWGTAESLTDLALDENGNLHIFTNGSGMAFLVIAPMHGTDSNWRGEYQRLKDSSSPSGGGPSSP